MTRDYQRLARDSVIQLIENADETPDNLSNDDGLARLAMLLVDDATEWSVSNNRTKQADTLRRIHDICEYIDDEHN